MVRDRFARFEAHIERLVEGSFSRLFSGHLHPREIAVQLARAMEDSARRDGNGQMVAPDSYSVSLNPSDYESILNRLPDLPETLASELVDMARAAGLLMPAVPEVHIVPDPGVASHRASVQSGHGEVAEDETDALETVTLDPEADPRTRNASLVTGEGERVVSLDREVFNIGRSRQNQLILNDPAISRQHAQVRLRFGRFVLYDLDSRSGTVVNGQTVHECILENGDVITLGAARLIYTEDADGTAGAAQDGDADAPGDTEANPPVEASH